MLRSSLNPEECGVVVGNPTLYRIDANRHRLLCGKCCELCYVDETVFRRASRTMLEGHDNPFLCLNCEEEPEIWLFAE